MKRDGDSGPPRKFGKRADGGFKPSRSAPEDGESRPPRSGGEFRTTRPGDGTQTGDQEPRGASRLRFEGLLKDASELLAEFRESGSPADVTAGRYFKDNRRLGSHDRRFLGDSFFHLLRNLRRIDEAIESAFTGTAWTHRRLHIGFPVIDATAARTWQASTAPGWEGRRIRRSDADVWLDAVRVGLAGCELDSTIVNDVVSALLEAWRRLPAPDDPGPLSEAAQERMFSAAIERMHSFREDDSPSKTDRRASLPSWLWGILGEGLGRADAIELALSLGGTAEPCIRVNTLRCTMAEAEEALAEMGLEYRRSRWAANGLILGSRVARPMLPRFQEGWFEFQDESSQLCAELAAPAAGMLVVDACAGGGGKALHFAALMNNDGRVLAFDISRKRLDGATPRLARSGAEIIEVVGEEPGDITAIGADIVLVDAPCSGTGTLRRSPELRWRLTPERLAELVGTQAQLLDKWAAAVRPGGLLVYSTCSVLRMENAAQVDAFLERNPDFERDVEGASMALGRNAGALMSKRGDLETYPHRHGCDGFFAARLRRRG